MGLIRAIRQYDPSSHGNIGSYLPLWIQQYIDRAVANTGRMIRLPVHMIETLRKIETSSEKLTELYARRPTLDELAQETELPLNILNQLINGIQITVSLDYLFETDENFDIADSDASMVDNIVGDNLLKLQIDEILKTLTPKEKKVIQLRFGLSDDSEWTLEEIGQMFGVTRERIRQIEAKAMRNLNHPTRLNKLRDFLYNE
jgi:RNA polymerase primary sigma factor